MTDTDNVDALRQTDEAVPLRKRPIPDQIDYYVEKLAAQIDTERVPREAIIAMGAAIIGMGSIASELRAQQQPLDDTALDEIRRRNRYLADIPFDTHRAQHSDGCPPCGMVRSIHDVTRLLAERDRLTDELAGAVERARAQPAVTEMEWGLLADGFDADRTRGVGKGETGRHTAYADQQLYHRVMQRRAASNWREAP